MKKYFMNRRIITGFVVAGLLLVTACNPAKKYEEEERILINEYLASHDITVAPDASGLYYIETVPGTGDKIEIGDSIGVYYKGTFLDGTQFDSNLEEDTPYRFNLDIYGLIEGWIIGLQKMQLGTEAKLLLPSKLAYGAAGFGYYDYYGRYISVIPGYTPLLFEVQIVELTKKTK